MTVSPGPLRRHRARIIAFEALERMRRADDIPDPVASRRADASAAKQLREAADLLDDEGRLAD